MSVDAGSVYSSIRVRLGDLDNDLKGVYARLNQLEGNITKTTNNAKKSTNAFTSSFNDLTKSIVSGQLVVDGIKKGISLFTGAIKDSIQVSVAAQEMISKYDVVFGGMGGAAETAAKRFSKAFDLAGATAKEMLSNTGNLLQGMGATKEESLELSVKVNELASDLASFTNNQGGAGAASEALTKALLGERESMKTLGIAIRDSDVNARLAKKGMDNLEGTALNLAKAQVTLELITEQSKNAIGDYARTSDSASNSQKRAAEATKELQIQIGGALNGTMKVFANLWTGASTAISETIKRSTGVGELKGATDDLAKSSSEYNEIVNTLNTDSKTLSDTEKGILEGRKNMLAQQIEQQAIALAKAYNDEQKEVEKVNKEYQNTSNEMNGLILKQTELKEKIKDTNKTWNNLASQEKADYRSMADASGVYATSTERDNAAKKLMAKQLNDDLLYVGQNITALNGKYIESGDAVKTLNEKNQEALYSIARLVNDGTISIERYNNTSNKGYQRFYNDVISATASVKELDKVSREKAEADKKAAEANTALAKRQLSEEEQIAARKKAEITYNEAILKISDKLKAGLISTKQATDLNADAANKYLDVLYDLGYALDSEIGTKGRAAMDSMIKITTDYNATQKTQADNYEYVKELLGSINELDIGYRKSALVGLVDQINAMDLDIEKKKELLALVKATTDATTKAANEQDKYNKGGLAGLNTLITGFGLIGEELAKGSLGWEDFAKLGLNAIASVIDAIGQEILALTAANFIRDGGIYSPLAWANAAAGAGKAAVAFTAAGLVRGFAGSFEEGGIVPGRSFTGDNMIARVNSGEEVITRDDPRNALNGGGSATFILEVDGYQLAKIAAPYYSNGNVRLKLK